MADYIGSKLMGFELFDWRGLWEAPAGRYRRLVFGNLDIWGLAQLPVVEGSPRRTLHLFWSAMRIAENILGWRRRHFHFGKPWLHHWHIVLQIFRPQSKFAKEKVMRRSMNGKAGTDQPRLSLGKFCLFGSCLVLVWHQSWIIAWIFRVGINLNPIRAAVRLVRANGSSSE